MPQADYRMMNPVTFADPTVVWQISAGIVALAAGWGLWVGVGSGLSALGFSARSAPGGVPRIGEMIRRRSIALCAAAAAAAATASSGCAENGSKEMQEASALSAAEEDEGTPTAEAGPGAVLRRRVPSEKPSLVDADMEMPRKAKRRFSFVGELGAFDQASDRMTDSAVRLDEPFYPPGLYNMGNTCFMNSVIQSMVALPSLFAYLRDRCYVYNSPLVPRPKDGSEKPPLLVTEAMLDLTFALNDLQRARKVLRPSNLMSALAAAKPGNRRMMCYEQQFSKDAHELLQLLSSTLTDEEAPGPPSVHSLLDVRVLEAECGRKKRPRRELAGAAAAAALQDQTVEASDVAESFDGFDGEYNDSAVRHATFDNISLPVPRKSQASIESLLESYVSPEAIHEYICDKCSLVATLKGLEADIEDAQVAINFVKMKRAQFKKETDESGKGSGKKATAKAAALDDEMKAKLRVLVGLEKNRKIVAEAIRFDVEAKLVGYSKIIAISLTSNVFVNVQPDSVKRVKVVSKLSRKQILIASPPSCLCLHMQRSVYLPSGHVMKNNCNVLFDEILDIGAFCTNGGNGLGPGGGRIMNAFLGLQTSLKVSPMGQHRNITAIADPDRPPLEDVGASSGADEEGFSSGVDGASSTGVADDLTNEVVTPPTPTATPTVLALKKMKRGYGITDSDESAGETTTLAGDADSEVEEATKWVDGGRGKGKNGNGSPVKDVDSEASTLLNGHERSSSAKPVGTSEAMSAKPSMASKHIASVTADTAQVAPDIHSPPPPYPYLYRLHAVVLHYGSHDSGHFVTYRRVPHPTSREYESSMTLRSRVEEEVVEAVGLEEAEAEIESDDAARKRRKAGKKGGVRRKADGASESETGRDGDDEETSGASAVEGLAASMFGAGLRRRGVGAGVAGAKVDKRKRKVTMASGGATGGTIVGAKARWFRISDDRVDVVTDLEADVFGHGAAYVYMLFYEKIVDGKWTPEVGRFVVGEDHDKFAAVIDKKDEINILDEDFGLLAQYKRLCESKLHHLMDIDEGDSNIHNKAEAASRTQWQLELQTWKLVSFMIEQKRMMDAEPPPKPHAYVSDYALTNYALATDPALAEYNAVKLWLEQTAPEFIPCEIRKGYWPYSVKRARESSDLRLVKDLDPDGPARTKIPLAAEDSNYEKDLNQTIWEYQRRGKLVEAMDLCRDCGQHWRAASLGGVLTAMDCLIDGEDDPEAGDGGNVNRDLWKAISFEIASSNAYTDHERAVYGALSGDYINVLPVCKTWEDHVWAHYNALVEQTVEENLTKIPRPCDTNDVLSVRTPREAKLPMEVFDGLLRHPSQEIRSEAAHPFRIVQTLLILGQMDELLSSLRARLAEGIDSIPYLPQILRFVVHLIHLFRVVLHPYRTSEDADWVIQCYVELLVVTRKFQDVEPDKERRHHFLRQAAKYGLEVRPIALLAVDLILSEGILFEPLPQIYSAIFISGLNDPVPHQDQSAISALDFFLFNAYGQNEDLLLRSNQVIPCGRLNSASQTLSRIPKGAINDEWKRMAVRMAQAAEEDEAMEVDSVQERLAMETIEHENYVSLIQAANHHSQWMFLQRKWADREETNKENEKESFEYLDWVKEMEVESDAEARPMLTSGEDSDRKMREIASGVQQRDKELQFLRNLYIPQCFIWLHQILYETRDIIPPNLDRCKELYKLVKEGDPEGFYTEFVNSARVQSLHRMLKMSEEAKR
ncbi:Nucleoporin nup84 [Irineochytrium annulatum]|nr:Nucleoporin nup84 [Irineochytrium annulatum]